MKAETDPDFPIGLRPWALSQRYRPGTECPGTEMYAWRCCVCCGERWVRREGECSLWRKPVWNTMVVASTGQVGVTRTWIYLSPQLAVLETSVTSWMFQLCKLEDFLFLLKASWCKVFYHLQPRVLNMSSLLCKKANNIQSTWFYFWKKKKKF